MKPSTWKIACAVTGAMSLLGCNLNRGDDVDDTPAPPVAAPPPTPAEQPAAAPAANEVVRYTNMEIVVQGPLSVRNPVRARAAADFTSTLVDTLPVGAEVERVAMYNGFTLVAWESDSGARQGWIDGAQATRTTALVPTTTATVTSVPVAAVTPVTTPVTSNTFKPLPPKPGTTVTPPKPVTTPKPATTPKPVTTSKPPTLGTPTGKSTKPPKLGK